MSSKRDHNAITHRILEQMERAKLDALVLTTADAIFYATGYASAFLYMSARPGETLAVVTKEGKEAIILSEFERQAALIATEENREDITLIDFPTWIYIEDYDDGSDEKEVQPDLSKTYRLAADFILQGAKVKKTDLRIGIQPENLPHSGHVYLASVFGEENLVDARQALAEARAIKTPWEIDLLRRAAHYAELAMLQTAREVVPGMTNAEVAALFVRHSYAQSPDVVRVGTAHTIGENFAPAYIQPETRVLRGDIIRLDGGPSVLGYNSDLARTFAVGGQTGPERERLYDQLWSGYDYAVNHIGPGVKMSDIFNGIHRVLKEKGLGRYVRGHQGHSLGCGVGEEYPFIAPGEDRVFEPGMVFCLELPYYSSKNHSYNIEDTLLITETGIELFSNAGPSLYL